MPFDIIGQGVGPGSTRPETNSASGQLGRVNSAWSFFIANMDTICVPYIWYLEDRYYQSTLEIIRTVAGGDNVRFSMILFLKFVI